MGDTLTRAQLVEKWSEVEGKVSIKDMDDAYIKENMAQLLENQEQKDLHSEMLGESTTFSTVAPSSEATGQFKPIALALVRRTFPELFANKIVGVQAMNGPVGLAYALRIKYKDKTQEAAFDNVDDYSGFTGSISGTSGTADTGTGVTAATAEAWQMNPGTGQMPELKLTIDRTAIEAKTRKLAASYSLEAAQDIKAMHQIDIEREMVNTIQYEVLAEMDRELLQKLKTVAVDTSKGGEAATAYDVSASDGRWSQEKYANVLTIIVKKGNDVATSTRRAAANFVVVSPRVATALQSAGKQFSNNNASVNATGTMAMVGSINGTITVYRDTYATADYALLGYKGPGQSDAGVIYSPYLTGVLSRATAEEDFSPRLGVMSRYAITDSLLGAGRYYRLINFSNLDAVLGA